MLLPLVSVGGRQRHRNGEPLRDVEWAVAVARQAWACRTTVAETPGASWPTSMPLVAVVRRERVGGPHAIVIVTRHHSALPRCEDSDGSNFSVE